MSSKKFGLGCLTILGVAIALGVGGRYLSQQILGKELTPLDAAKVIPDEALFATFIETDTEKWSEVKELFNQPSQKFLDSQIETLETELTREFPDLDYQSDIQPWLDGAMFALIGEDINGYDAEVLFVFGVKNKLKANSFAKKLSPYQAQKQESKHKGITITESTSQDGARTSSALIDNRLLLAENKNTIERAIDAYKEKSSLASNAKTKEIFNHKLDQGTTIAQVYLPNYSELMLQGMEIDPDVANLYSELMSIYDSVDSATMALGVESQGLRLRSITTLNSDEFSQYVTPNRGKLLKRFPDRTVMALNGGGISQFWSQMQGWLKQNRDTSRSFNLAKLGVRQTTGLNLESDIFNWMDGEFAFGIISTPESLHPQFDLNYSAGLILETSQPDKAEATIAKLEQSLQNNLQLVPTRSKINRKEVTQLSTPGMDGALNYGWLDKNNLLFTWDDFTFESISKGKKSLTKSNSFKALSKKVPDRNLGYFYLDVDPVINTINQFPLDRTSYESQTMMAFLDSLDAIASNATMPDKRTAQQDIFIMFKDN